MSKPTKDFLCVVLGLAFGVLSYAMAVKGSTYADYSGVQFFFVFWSFITSIASLILTIYGLISSFYSGF